jgi:hypothetical protein
MNQLIRAIEVFVDYCKSIHHKWKCIIDTIFTNYEVSTRYCFINLDFMQIVEKYIQLKILFLFELGEC